MTPREQPRVDARVLRSREKVLTAALAVLAEAGVGGVSVDEVARRSGVAKTTIYRHWTSHADLVLEVCGRLSTPQHAPPDAGLRADLTALLEELARLLTTEQWAGVLPSVVDAAERDPALAALHARSQRAHAEPYLAVLHRAVDAGTLPASTDLPALVAALVGPLFYRRWFSREALDGAFVAQVVTTALDGAGG